MKNRLLKFTLIDLKWPHCVDVLDNSLEKQANEGFSFQRGREISETRKFETKRVHKGPITTEDLLTFQALIINYTWKNVSTLIGQEQCIFFLTVQKRVNSVQKEETNQAFWLVNDQRNSQMAIKSFAFKSSALDGAIDGAIFPDCEIRVRLFCFTISKCFHVYS